MNTVVKTVNIIRARGLYHREFQAFLSDVDAEYGDVLYHSDVRWLSRGSLLQRFYSLRSEIDKFLKEKGRPLHKLSDPLWLADLAFLVDLTHHLNTLNKNLQGKEQLVSHLYAHMKAFCVKLRLFETQLRSFNAAHFPALSEIKSAFPKADLSAKKEKYASVITSLVTEFNQRFSVIEKQIKLFSTPFLVDAEEVEESLQLELIEMQCDDSLKSQHQLLSLPDFYQSLDHAKFPLMRRHAKRMMSLFGSTYICEQTFSLLNQNKSRLRSRMTIAISVKSFMSQPPNFLLTSQPSFNPKDSITAPTESNVLHIIGDLEIHTVIMCQYVTSCVWPGPLLIFLYLALTKKTLDTPALAPH
ncbi:general transcription factor II-I repeat domain-containing protein 2-like [Siniperca chuatsi]|uniref:general transcription factor II-I repeat domain-containing protein 2-like n=1 Tax=Siniperca chuatsi TaxID=119488 RepID=UPI001CE06481|nr:general transcription factor II-I repeat domain-containing protein 2-like [Siniperca chuatsi]